MTAAPSIDPARFLQDEPAQASPDLMRDSHHVHQCAVGQRRPTVSVGPSTGPAAEWTNRRNGYRHRDLDTRAGTIDVAIPKLREGSFFPDWLLTRRRRAEEALVTVVATCYLLGVSTRRMDKLVRTPGITGLSKSTVSEMAKDLDEQVAAALHPSAQRGPVPVRGRGRTGGDQVGRRATTSNDMAARTSATRHAAKVSPVGDGPPRVLLAKCSKRRPPARVGRTIGVHDPVQGCRGGCTEEQV